MKQAENGKQISHKRIASQEKQLRWLQTRIREKKAAGEEETSGKEEEEEGLHHEDHGVTPWRVMQQQQQHTMAKEWRMSEN